MKILGNPWVYANIIHMNEHSVTLDFEIMCPVSEFCIILSPFSLDIFL